MVLWWLLPLLGIWSHCITADSTAETLVDVEIFDTGSQNQPVDILQIFNVDVGTFDGKHQFIPNQVDAKVGDLILFNFLAKSHSLTQSEFATPCTYNGVGFDTGLNQNNPTNESDLFVIPFVVVTEQPQWFYCRQSGHCSHGMVFGLNSAGQMDQFVANAMAQQ